MSFKDCPTCSYCWNDRDALLSDKDVHLLGYQVNFSALEAGYFLFNHDTPECGTSLAIEVGSFTDMHAGPIFKKRLHGTEKCPGYCLDKDELQPCPEQCECAFVRNVLQIIRNWPKVDSATRQRTNAL